MKTIFPNSSYCIDFHWYKNVHSDLIHLILSSNKIVNYELNYHVCENIHNYHCYHCTRCFLSILTSNIKSTPWFLNAISKTVMAEGNPIHCIYLRVFKYYNLSKISTYIEITFWHIIISQAYTNSSIYCYKRNGYTWVYKLYIQDKALILRKLIHKFCDNLIIIFL